MWNVTYHEDTQTVVLALSGKVTGAELKAAAVARIDFGRKKGTRLYIIDASDMLAPKSTILDVLEIPTTLYFNKRMDRTSRIAVIEPRDLASRWITTFYENSSVMRGWTVQIFADHDSAASWLASTI